MMSDWNTARECFATNSSDTCRYVDRGKVIASIERFFTNDFCSFFDIVMRVMAGGFYKPLAILAIFIAIFMHHGFSQILLCYLS